jgi:hypothetical protein
LIQAQTIRIEAASDAVRDSILDSADQALGRINNTLDNSFKFFFGKIKDQNPDSPVHSPELPKTLEDARKLVSSPRLSSEDNASVSVASSVVDEPPSEDKDRRSDLGAKMTDLFAGRRQIRDRSVDSTQSGGSSSGKRVAFQSSPNEGKPPLATIKTEPVPTSNPSAVDSLRNIGNNLNPLNRFASINVLPRFGRAVSGGNGTPTIATPAHTNTESPVKQLATPPAPARGGSAGSSDMAQVDDKGIKAVAALETLRKTTPPVKRFLEAKDAQDLKLREVDELLREYQRLAAAMRGAINFAA